MDHLPYLPTGTLEIPGFPGQELHDVAVSMHGGSVCGCLCN